MMTSKHAQEILDFMQRMSVGDTLFIAKRVDMFSSISKKSLGLSYLGKGSNHDHAGAASMKLYIHEPVMLTFIGKLTNSDNANDTAYAFNDTAYVFEDSNEQQYIFLEAMEHCTMYNTSTFSIRNLEVICSAFNRCYAEDSLCNHCLEPAASQPRTYMIVDLDDVHKTRAECEARCRVHYNHRSKHMVEHFKRMRGMLVEMLGALDEFTKSSLYIDHQAEITRDLVDVGEDTESDDEDISDKADGWAQD